MLEKTATALSYPMLPKQGRQPDASRSVIDWLSCAIDHCDGLLQEIMAEKTLNSPEAELLGFHSKLASDLKERLRSRANGEPVGRTDIDGFFEDFVDVVARMIKEEARESSVTEWLVINALLMQLRHIERLSKDRRRFKT